MIGKNIEIFFFKMSDGVKDFLKIFHDPSHFIAIISLIALTLYQGLYYFNYYYVPNTDFILDVVHDTKLVQEIFFHPEKLISNLEKLTYKRLPFYLTILSVTELFTNIFISIRLPFLFTAQVINLFLSLLAVTLIYIFSSKILGKFGFLVPILILFNKSMVYVTAHPTFDLLLINTVFLTLYLSLKNSKKSYFTAFLATMTKPEGILIVPSILIKDLLYSNKKMFVLLIGIIISLPLLLWIFLSYRFIGYYPLLTEMITQEGKRFKFFFNIISEIINTFYPQTGIREYLFLLLFEAVILILFFIGVYSLIKNRELILSSVIFLLTYTLAQSIHPYTNWRYILTILPIIIIFIIQGFKLVIKKFYEIWKIHRISKFESVYLLICAFSILLIIFYNKSVMIRLLDIKYLYFSFIGTATCFLIYETKTIGLWKRLSIISIGILVFSFIISENLIYTKNFLNEDNYSIAELRFIGEWCRYNIIYNDTLVTPDAGIVAYFCDQNRNMFNVLSSEDIKCDSQRCLVDKLKFLEMKNGAKKTYLAIPSYIFDPCKKVFCPPEDLYFSRRWYLLDNIATNYKENFRLIKEIIIGPRTLLIYEFVNST